MKSQMENKPLHRIYILILYKYKIMMNKVLVSYKQLVLIIIILLLVELDWVRIIPLMPFKYVEYVDEV